ncbi:MAG TPA: hypothetical protein DCM28_23880 [Phycisphaerales bacterium]|nr:hypothetical protein [Phycisphaerales bacterium]HCD31852.1 hypothetical protein [Phycisphaerales bacterium]|tara:strand:+ start:5085 stop:7589 length:2505 start_codon:yes stop_codon:yes gene_type:complete
MAQDSEQPQDASVEDESLGEIPEYDSGTPHWSQNWQLPALVLGMVMLTMGMILAWPSDEPTNYDAALDSVQAYLRANDLESAHAKLAKDQLFMDAETTPPRIRGRYWQLWGDLIYKQVKQQNIPSTENFNKIVASYSRADDHEYPFDGEHLSRWASTLVSLDRVDEALQKIDKVKLADRNLKWQLIRQIINMQIARRRDTADDLLDWYDAFFAELQYETDPDRKREAEVWGVTQYSLLLMQTNDAGRVIDYLHLRYIRLRDDGGEDDLGSVKLRLAQAYQMGGQYELAMQWYHAAQKSLKPENLLNAQVLVGMAQITLALSGDVRKAHEVYSTAAMKYGATDEFIDATIGQADCEARLGVHAQAIKHLLLAAKSILDKPHPLPRHKEMMIKVAHDNFELQFGQDQYGQALSYLSTLKPLYGQNLPATILGDFAITHEKLGDTHTAEAMRLQNIAPVDAFASEENHKAYELANQEAALQYGRSGDYYYDHALAVTIADDHAHGNSLWQAGQNYDKAQMWDRAIDAYREFARVRSNDPRFVLAINHLGLAYQADGQYKVAFKLFEELVEKHPKSEAAIASLVPMAQCMVEMGENEQAQRTLQYVLTDNKAVTPEGDTYREALIELGKLHFTTGEYLKAITRLEEAIDEKRYGNSEQSPILRYRLADSYRLSVGDLNKALADPMPQAKRMELQKRRVDNLERAGVLYSQAINQFEARNPKTLTKLETAFFRNAYFYRGDCAYDLTRWDDAITLYDLAAKKWESHPASLVALVQIVNAYCEQGAMQEARAANDRARYQLKRIPDEAFSDPSMPMGRKHWEDWLRWSNELDLFASTKTP